MYTRDPARLCSKSGLLRVYLGPVDEFARPHFAPELVDSRTGQMLIFWPNIAAWCFYNMCHHAINFHLTCPPAANKSFMNNEKGWLCRPRHTICCIQCILWNLYGDNIWTACVFWQLRLPLRQYNCLIFTGALLIFIFYSLLKLKVKL
jgi:hypothetical protein